MGIKQRSIFQDHPFHLVSPSPWPVYTSLCLLGLTSNSALFMHNFEYASYLSFVSLFFLVASMFFWFKDITTEGTYLGDHTLVVQQGVNIGIMLFIISEVFFFLAIFWAFFHSALSPTVELGAQWPPFGIQPVNPFELPLLNTVILLSSGATITFAHHSLMSGDRTEAVYFTIISISLAIVFTIFQGIEYVVSSFTISDGVYGACFFFGTGFHGIHVIIGTIFLLVALVLIVSYHATDNHHQGYESAILYWHFVDVVWLFLYIAMYYWGS